MTGATVRLEAAWRVWGSHFFIILVFATLLRLPYFNNPGIHIDEQYYLVVADKWINGDLLPYVDIWDRKPLGTFLVYALAVVLFANAVVGYQVLGLLSIVATCWAIYRIGEQIADRTVALGAALIYAVAPMLMEGAAGQTPVFYNLPVAVAALLYVRHAADDASPRRPWATTVAASLLLGVAVQIKYIAAFEAAALSLFALAVFAVAGMTRVRLSAVTAVMIACGVLPTGLVAAGYALIGRWDEFFFANFQSIFAKRIGALPHSFAWEFGLSTLFCIVFLPFAASGLRHALSRARGDRLIMIGLAAWLGAAFLGAIILGNPNRHYFLPTLPPLALFTAIGVAAFAQQLSRRRVFAGMLVLPVIASFAIAEISTRNRGEADDIYAIGDYIKTHLGDRCPFVFNRLPILYTLSGACIPTKYAFPGHLIESSELDALPVDSLGELRRVLEARPPMVFVRRPYAADVDERAIAVLEQFLQSHYDLQQSWPGAAQRYFIYVPRQHPSAGGG